MPRKFVCVMHPEKARTEDGKPAPCHQMTMFVLDNIKQHQEEGTCAKLVNSLKEIIMVPSSSVALYPKHIALKKPHKKYQHLESFSVNFAHQSPPNEVIVTDGEKTIAFPVDVTEGIKYNPLRQLTAV